MNDYSGGLGILIEEKEPQVDETQDYSSPPKCLSHSSSSSVSNHNSLTMSSHLTSNSESGEDKIPVNVILTGSSSPPPGFQATPIPTISAVISNSLVDEVPPNLNTSESNSEVLLPPLPDESDDYFVNTHPVESVAEVKSLSTPVSSSFGHDQNDINEMVRSTSISNSVLHSITTGSTTDVDSEKHLRYFAYELDSPSLKLDSSNLLYFPSMTETSTNPQTTPLVSTVTTSSTLATSSSSNPSPLKGLKSLKNGIRKLSLSKHSSSNSQSQASLQHLLTRPILSPLQTNNSQVYLNLSASTVDSMKSSAPLLGGIPISNSSNNLTSTLSRTKPSRSRTLSNSQSSPPTPTMASPVITLSEDLAYCKKNLNQIEQNFFDSLLNARSSADSGNSSLYENESISSGNGNVGVDDGSARSTPMEGSSTSIAPYSRQRIESISELNKPEELIDYCNYLNEQKKSTVDAFEITRDRLIKSGWCSDHDLNNLQLQQDSSLCQIDTKILQIEEKLNSSFNLSLWNKSVPSNIKRVKSTTTANPISRILLESSNQSNKDLPISPSLKTLESRLSFA